MKPLNCSFPTRQRFLSKAPLFLFLALSPLLSLILSFSRSLSRSLSFFFSFSPSLSLTHSHTHTLTHILFPSRTFSLSLSHTHTFSLSQASNPELARWISKQRKALGSATLETRNTNHSIRNSKPATQNPKVAVSLKRLPFQTALLRSHGFLSKIITRNCANMHRSRRLVGSRKGSLCDNLTSCGDHNTPAVFSGTTSERRGVNLKGFKQCCVRARHECPGPP